jgi:hypothetical protein
MSEDYYATEAPKPEEDPPHGRLIEYDTATVITPMIYPPQPRLVVNGQKPRPGMEVNLVPVTYIQQPEYWEIHVLGSLGDPLAPPTATQLPTDSAYSVELDLAGCTGTAGIEVVGANGTERIDVAGTPPETE